MSRIIWIIFVIWTVFLFVAWLTKKSKFRKGFFYDTGELLAFYTVPQFLIVGAIVLILFVVLKINSLHLFWLYPLIYFTLSYINAKKITESDKKNEEFFREDFRD